MHKFYKVFDIQTYTVIHRKEGYGMGTLFTDKELEKTLEINEKKAIYNTLEKVFNKINSHDDLSQIKLDLAGDIFVAKVILDLAEKGSVNEQDLKTFISQYL